MNWRVNNGHHTAFAQVHCRKDNARQQLLAGYVKNTVDEMRSADMKIIGMRQGEKDMM